MVTNSGTLGVPNNYTSQDISGGNASEATPTSSTKIPFRESSSALELTALKRQGSSRETRSQEILELVVAAVTVVADVLTLALSRASERERRAPSKPIGLLPLRPQPREGNPAAMPGTRTTIPVAPPVLSKRLEAIQSDSGEVTVRTFDGYIVRAHGGQSAWSITAPDGKTTQVMKDGRVRESDGGAWSLSERGSFLFGAHKLTMEISRLSTGAVIPSKITLYSEGERVTIGGLDMNRPTIQAASGDARYHDDAVQDGSTFIRNGTKRGESWSSLLNGRRHIMEAR